MAVTLSLPLAVGFSGSSNWHRTALYLPDLMSSEFLLKIQKSVIGQAKDQKTRGLQGRKAVRIPGELEP
jgi:hypothetical protein